jgi:hypothetical protein
MRSEISSRRAPELADLKYFRGEHPSSRRFIRDQNGSNARPSRTLGDQSAPIPGLKRTSTTENYADIGTPSAPGQGAGLRPHTKIPLDTAREGGAEARCLRQVLAGGVRGKVIQFDLFDRVGREERSGQSVQRTNLVRVIIQLGN